MWDIPVTEKTVYLTFDDGPTPEVTNRVLDFLVEYGAQATFFCSGNRAEKEPVICDMIIANGHTIGNHGYQHISGFTTLPHHYYQNTIHGADITNSKLFRPPYGHITPWHFHILKNYCKIVMWSVMSMDFDSKVSPLQCVRNVKDHIYPGAIVVFHDTVQAEKTLLQALPNLLKWLNSNGYKAKAIPNLPYKKIK